MTNEGRKDVLAHMVNLFQAAAHRVEWVGDKLVPGIQYAERIVLYQDELTRRLVLLTWGNAFIFFGQVLAMWWECSC